MQLSKMSDFHHVIHDMTSASIRKTIDASDLEINYFDNVTMFRFSAHLYLV